MQSIPFGNTVKKGSLLGNILLKRYFGSTAWLDDKVDDES